MSERTTNFGLVKPGQDDAYNVGDFNGNMDAVDAELGRARDHRGDREVHLTGEDRAQMSDHEGRIQRLEDALFNDLTANPFMVRFDDLSGVEVTGVWNRALQRIEC